MTASAPRIRVSEMPAQHPAAPATPAQRRARILIVQDGGIYYHTRAMGFEFAEA